MDHPNIMAAQSFHNAGGMILRGPGASYNESLFPGNDTRVYDEIAQKGEQLLPYYRSMVTYRDLYTVHGGFVDWMAAGRGAYTFTNEMWSDSKYFQRDVASPTDKQMWLFRDRLQFGQVFTPYKEFNHPQFGKVLIGGLNKWSSRVTPTFMLEEECHRNFGFTMLHADQMPIVEFGRAEVAKAGGMWVLTVEVRNQKLMPTRSGVARNKGVGTNDVLMCEPTAGGKVETSGMLSSWIDPRIDPVRYEPGRVQLESGVPGRGSVIVRFYISGKEGETVKLTYQGEKVKSVETSVELKLATPPRTP